MDTESAGDRGLPASVSAVEVVTTGPRLAAVCDAAMRQPRVAVDLESNGFYRYPERVCLVQLATSDDVHVIDPLSIDDPAPLGRLLADPSVGKIFHSADYDIRSLDRDWGFRVRGLFDTSIAAAFVGSEKLGLAAVLKEYLDVDVDKDKKLQRADWSRRPLTEEMLRYAAQDVIHLGKLKAVLDARLARLGRTEWVREETERLAGVRFTPPDDEWGFLTVKGSRDLDGRGLAVLRSLHSFRENEALVLDRPPFKVMSDSVIAALASDPRADIGKVKGIGEIRPGSRRLRGAPSRAGGAEGRAGAAAPGPQERRATDEPQGEGQGEGTASPTQGLALQAGQAAWARPAPGLAGGEPGTPGRQAGQPPLRAGVRGRPPVAAPRVWGFAGSPRIRGVGGRFPAWRGRQGARLESRGG